MGRRQGNAERRSGSDRRAPGRLGVRNGIALAMAVVGVGGTGFGYHRADVAEHSVALSQREADKRGEARDRYEALMYDCLNRRIDDGHKR